VGNLYNTRPHSPRNSVLNKFLPRQSEQSEYLTTSIIRREA
jgi:hypothetical protein